MSRTNNGCCRVGTGGCRGRPAGRDAASAGGPGRRLRRGVAWLGSTAALLLVPKCPMCLAAYVAVATGITLPAGVAAGLRYAMIAGGAGAIALLVLTATMARRRAR